MKLDDLWIGDVLKIRSTGQVGVFNGITTDGLAIIKSDQGVIHHISEKNLEKYTEPEKPLDLVFEDDLPHAKQSISTFDSTDTIDLHYDSLTQYYPHERGTILDFQIEKCNDFILKSLSAGTPYIRIIHGKGEGILKKAVETLVKKYSSQISLSSAHYDGASIDVWFAH
jgi:dsDNA-specific endonuclease/ATPase MutS2